jgi:hypothetical protein
MILEFLGYSTDFCPKGFIWANNFNQRLIMIDEVTDFFDEREPGTKDVVYLKF